ncbi:hypothetical protein [Streptomyces sp. V1I6]|uniref:hypothetical protein n=1 Tax=Streptomyces sp. V1I6 TaxID=3042273 RepID=UPI00277D27D0|nr:hypothetical protein [Streptomyces sp. V1I6]MDQ0840397.1 hypothetical protein [Streptomyces sp. V1I6]
MIHAQDPARPTARHAATMAELLDGYGRAVEVPEMLRAAASADPGARYVLARRYQAAGQHDAAIDLLADHLTGERQFSDDMLCSVALATLLRDQGRVDDSRLVLWSTAHLNWLEGAGELIHHGMWNELDDVVWAVDASGLVLPDNFQYLRGRIVRDDLDLDPALEP